MKICPKCKQPAEFNKNGTTSDGLQRVCKVCHASMKRRPRTPEEKARYAEVARSPARRIAQARSHHRGRNGKGFAIHGDLPPLPEGGLCECCGKKPKAGQLIMDHDHTREFDNFRAWLCNHCNLGFGHLGDTLERLEHAVSFWRGRYEQLARKC